MKILLTGVAGFIASHTAEKLLAAGHDVIGLDEVNDYYDVAWKQENLARLEKYPNFSFVKLDLRDLTEFEPIFQENQFDAIMNLAGRAGVRPSIADPVLYEEVNARGTLNLLEMAKKHQIKRFILASSSSVYGNQTKVPFTETDPVNEPISPYAASKKSAEMYCHVYAHLYGIKTACLRFFTVYGPNGRPDMAPYLFTEAILTGKPIKKFGNGETKRDYTYIDDIVSGVVASLNLENKFEIINLGNNNPVSLNEFISTLEEITGLTMKIEQLPMQPGDVEVTYSDISKAQKLLDYQPKTSFKEGMTKFVAWYKAQRT
ncbi:MAG: epimerase [Candidatus Pacebacteria bacterium CG10_big_fil_rev_8_21_14_0_10_36_11]|nr:MAG: epimerase [Candidatus Pacebacteria bacterium CG10_big_fil_rev_8_21_14_0_10_36_11]